MKCHVFWRFLAVCVEKTRCYRRFTEYSYSHAFSSIVAVRLLGEKWYLFLYSWVFYTVNHLDIYRYVYYTYMFWWNPFFFDEKKKLKKTITTTTKTATSFHQSLPVWIKQIIACKPLSAAVCCFKESFTIKWKKSCQTNNQHLYSRIFVWKI